MAKLISKLLGLLQMQEMFNAGIKPVENKTPVKRRRGFVEGDAFYKRLSWKRRDGKWRVKQ